VRLLVLGGSVFVGRHVVEAALARGDEVTIFNRGRTSTHLFPVVERLQGDRDGGLDPLGGREWDIVVDTSGYVPRVVRQSAELLASAVDRYCFVSSMSVYSDFSHAPTETSPLLKLEDPASEDVMQHYGELKAACEDVVNAVYGERALVVRPGLVVGPYDPTGRFTYWVARMARDGTVLVPAPPERYVQFVDARDLAAWILHASERGASGPFNAVAPPIPFSELLEACDRAGGMHPTVEWVDPEFLLGAGVEPWTELPMWLPGEEFAGFEHIDSTKARSAGLVTRPLIETVRDTLAWANGLEGGDPARQDDGRYDVTTLTPEREAELLAAWHAR
jgi:2'-hydroxyisoflavone reductase